MAVASQGGTATESLQSLLSQALGSSQAGVSASQAGVANSQGGLAAVQSGGQSVQSSLNAANWLATQAARVTNGVDADISNIKSVAGGMAGNISSMQGSAANIQNIASQLGNSAASVGAYSGTFDALASNLLGRSGTLDAYGNQISGLAAGMAPYETALSGYGANIWNQGVGLEGISNGVLGIGNGLLGMDASSSSLANEFMRIYNSVNPNQYAAQAGADVQNASDSAYVQQMRDISRRGGSVTGGNALALQKQYKTALATAKAAAMTRARTAGLDKQAGYLKDIAATANTLLGTGGDLANASVNAKSAAATAQKGAADVRSAMGALYERAASVFGLGTSAVTAAGDQYKNAMAAESEQASILANQANVEKSAAGVYADAVSAQKTQADAYNSAGSLALSQASSLNDSASTLQKSASTQNSYLAVLNDAYSGLTSAYNSLASANQSAANTALSAASAEISANTSGRSGTVMASAQSSSDPWAATGHTETYWKNRLSSDKFAEMAQEIARQSNNNG